MTKYHDVDSSVSAIINNGKDIWSTLLESFPDKTDSELESVDCNIRASVHKIKQEADAILKALSQVAEEGDRVQCKICSKFYSFPSPRDYQGEGKMCSTCVDRAWSNWEGYEPWERQIRQ